MWTQTFRNSSCTRNKTHMLEGKTHFQRQLCLCQAALYVRFHPCTQEW